MLRRQLRELLSKSAALGGDETVFELSDFDIQEVSTVDAPANDEEWLLLKGLNMGSKKLQEILGNGVGEFVSKFEDEGTGAGAAPGQGEGEGAGAPAALRLSEATKSAALQNLGAVIQALMSVAKAVDSAEVATDAGDGLPSELQDVIRGAHQVLGQTVGSAPEGDGAAEGDAAADKSAGKTTEKTKVDNFGETLATLTNVVANLQGALGSSDDAAASEQAAGGEATDPALVKALADITKALGEHKTQLNVLKSHVGLPASRTPEDGKVQKGAASDDFQWPLNMNDKSFRRAQG